MSVKQTIFTKLHASWSGSPPDQEILVHDRCPEITTLELSAMCSETNLLQFSECGSKTQSQPGSLHQIQSLSGLFILNKSGKQTYESMNDVDTWSWMLAMHWLVHGTCTQLINSVQASPSHRSKVCETSQLVLAAHVHQLEHCSLTGLSGSIRKWLKKIHEVPKCS